LGATIDGRRVVQAGLAPQEEIVVNGLSRVRPGMTVVPQQEVAGGNPPSLAKR
jgi:multidrug efflux system membrane fusion protein